MQDQYIALQCAMLATSDNNDNAPNSNSIPLFSLKRALRLAEADRGPGIGQTQTYFDIIVPLIQALHTVRESFQSLPTKVLIDSASFLLVYIGLKFTD
jgi:hypothetical protein